MFLAGDIGGTKTRLALFSSQSGSLVFEREESYPSQKYGRLTDIVQAFLDPDTVLQGACFGVAGPVVRGSVRATNLPWEFSEEGLANDLKVKRVILLNDLVALAHSLPVLTPSDIEILYPGKTDREMAVSAILAPGTGLGQGYVHHVGGRDFVLPSEGSHVEFSPRTELEFALLMYLKKNLQRVSVERVVSGYGLWNIYSFLRDSKFAEESKTIAAKLESEDKGATIYLNVENDPLCSKTIELFVSLLGSHAGDTVLTYLSTRGLYLGGGIPARILPKLRERNFLEAYLNKGRLSPLVESTPVYLILNERAGLLGAAYVATQNA